MCVVRSTGNRELLQSEEFECGARILRTNQSGVNLPIIYKVQDHFHLFINT